MSIVYLNVSTARVRVVCGVIYFVASFKLNDKGKKQNRRIALLSGVNNNCIELYLIIPL